MTGNTVLFKPAMETVYIGWLVASLFWDAGVDRHTLQFIPTPDATGGTQTVQDPRINGVIVTGATETAKHLLSLRENLPLFAETGGKNTLIVTALADRDLAIKEIIHSSFNFSGQKCSACSLLILEKEVYEDPLFLEVLKDAANSLYVGASCEMRSSITPLIALPNEKLFKGLTTLEKGESWLLEPKSSDDNPHLWSPGIKLGVTPKSFTYQNELFGPVLGVMCAQDLEEAIELANGTPYGLTGGIHTLSEEEQKLWTARIRVGNGYINRSITGAIVQRQPFGGCKESHFGPGAKAGGPNYLHQFVHHIFQHTKEIATPLPEELAPFPLMLEHSEEVKRCEETLKQFHFIWETQLKKPQDPSKLLGEDNFLYFLPLKQCVVRLEEEGQKYDIVLLTALQEILHTRITVSSPFAQPEWAKSIEWKQEETLNIASFERLRLLTPPSKTLAQQLSDGGICPLVAPLFPLGEIELPRWTREFALSHVTHRYGSLLNTGTLP